MAEPAARNSKKFHLILIKPSHYDDGYVIQWRRAWIPSNFLSSVYGLALDAVESRVLGDVERLRRYRDVAITPVEDGEEENLQMYQSTDAARAALAKAKPLEARSRGRLESVSA